MAWSKLTGGTTSTPDPNSHTHNNKSTLDKISESGGSLLFNGSAVGGSGGGGSTTNKLSGKIWAALGDSVTQGGYWDNSNGVETVGTEALTYHEQIASKTGINAINYGIGGTCITEKASGGDGMSFVLRYQDMRNDADIITVMGGINDYAWAGNTPIGTWGSRDISTMYGAMTVLVEGLLQKYPGKPIGFIIPFPFNEYRGAGSWKPYYDAMMYVLNYYAIPVCDLYKESALNANVDFINQKFFKFSYGTTIGDKTHPNTNGHAVISRPIKSFLEKLAW